MGISLATHLFALPLFTFRYSRFAHGRVNPQIMSVAFRASVAAAVVAVVSAQIPIEFAKNITVYHVNPVQYGVAPVNMNTADLLGDMCVPFSPWPTCATPFCITRHFGIA